MNKVFWIVAAIFSLLLSVSSLHAAGDTSQIISVTQQGEDGEGKQDLVFIHGFASSSSVWQQTASELSKQYRLHLVQIKGFAGTNAPDTLPENYLRAIQSDVIHYIEQSELQQPVVIGHSMGGLLSLLIASEKPELLEKIVVVDALPFYSLMFNPMATSEQVKPMAEQMKQQLLSMNEERFAAQVNRSAGIMTKVDSKKATVKEWSLSSDREVYANLIAEVMAYDARSELSGIKAPVVVVNAFDTTMPLDKKGLTGLYKSAYQDVKDFELVTIDDSYHFIMWDQAEKFIQALNKVLNEE